MLCRQEDSTHSEEQILMVLQFWHLGQTATVITIELGSMMVSVKELYFYSGRYALSPFQNKFLTVKRKEGQGLKLFQVIRTTFMQMFSSSYCLTISKLLQLNAKTCNVLHSYQYL